MALETTKPTFPKKIKVFLSYSRKDVDLAVLLQEQLEKLGYEVFRDVHDIAYGEEWRQRIKNLITKSDVVVFVLSPRSAESIECQREVEFADSLTKRIIPLVIEEVDWKSVPGGLAERNSFTINKEEINSELPEAFITAIETDIDWVREHTRLGELAQYWEKNSKAENLLRGKELKAAESWLTKPPPPSARPPSESHHGFIQASQVEAQSRLYKWIAGSAITLLIIIVISIYGIQQRELKEQQENFTTIANAKKLSTKAFQVTSEGNATLGTLLSLEALSKTKSIKDTTVPDPEASLLNAIFAQQEKHVLEGHKGGINQVNFSPNGKLAVTASLDQTARVWDVDTGKSIHTLKGHKGQVYSARFSKDGKKIITGSSDDTARIWSVKTGKEIIKLVGHQNDVLNAFFFANDSKIATASWDGTARIWDANTGKEIESFCHKAQAVFWVDVSPNGKRLVTASADKTAKLWDLETGKEINTLNHDHWVLQATFSPNGSRIITASWDTTAKLWDGHSGKLLSILKGHVQGVSKALFSPNGKNIVTATAYKEIGLWNSKTGKLLNIFKEHRGQVNDVRFSSDNQRLISASADGTSRIWDIKNKKELKILSAHFGKVWSAAFSPDGKSIVTGSEDKTARLWVAKSPIHSLDLLDHKDRIHSIKLSPDKTTFLTSSDDRTARIWNIKTGKSIALIGHTHDVWYSIYSKDGNRALTASKDGTARIWDTSNGKLLHTLPQEKLNHVHFSPNGEQVVTGGEKGANIWSVKSGKKIKTLIKKGKTVNYVEFSPKGNRIVTATAKYGSDKRSIAPEPGDGTLQLWNNEGKLVESMDGHTQQVINGEFSIDGKYLVTTSWDHTAGLWNALTGHLIYFLKGHSEAVKVARFSSDGNFIVTGSSDNRARVWDIRKPKPSSIALIGHQGEVTDASFSEDNRLVFTTSEDGTARVWQRESGIPVLILDGHKNFVSGMQVLSNEKLATVSWDSTVKLWTFPIGFKNNWKDYALQTLPREKLSYDEKLLYLEKVKSLKK